MGTSADTNSRRDLLLSALALQNQLVTQEQVLEVTAVLENEPGRRTEDVYREMGYIDESTLDFLRGNAKFHLERHDGDCDQTIAALGSNPIVGRTLSLIAANPSELTVVLSGAKPVLAATTDTGERYLLGEELGRGGLGKVVIAVDKQLMDRQVAMKRGTARADRSI